MGRRTLGLSCVFRVWRWSHSFRSRLTIPLSRTRLVRLLRTAQYFSIIPNTQAMIAPAQVLTVHATIHPRVHVLSSALSMLCM
jgi:hypothetical protein